MTEKERKVKYVWLYALDLETDISKHSEKGQGGIPWP